MNNSPLTNNQVILQLYLNLLLSLPFPIDVIKIGGSKGAKNLALSGRGGSQLLMYKYRNIIRTIAKINANIINNIVDGILGGGDDGIGVGVGLIIHTSTVPP